MKNIEQKYEPFKKKEAAQLTESIEEMSLERDKLAMKIDQLNLSFPSLSKEIQLNVDTAKMELKAAEIKVSALIFDQKNDIHKRSILQQLGSMNKEIERHSQNIISLKRQLKQGKPISEETTMSEEPKVEPTPEEQTQGAKDLKDVPNDITEEEAAAADKAEAKAEAPKDEAETNGKKPEEAKPKGEENKGGDEKAE